jgi:hypothetical protein
MIMDENVSVWKANLTNGLVLGLVGVIYSLVLYFFDQTFNKNLGYLFLVIQIVVLYLLVKSYRDNYLHGFINYGRAVGAGVVIFLYTSVIAAIFSYILYKFIDTGLIAKSLQYTEEVMQKRGLSQEAIDAGMNLQRKIMKPGIMAFTSIFFGMLYGTVLSLIVAIFVRKEGNPLIDAPEIK